MMANPKFSDALVDEIIKTMTSKTLNPISIPYFGEERRRYGDIPSTEESLVRELDQTRRDLDSVTARANEMQKFLEHLQTQPFNIVRVAAVQGDRIIVRGPSGWADVAAPSFKVVPGDAVRVVSQTNQIHSKALIEPPLIGPVAKITAVTPSGCEVTVGNGGPMAVLVCHHLGDLEVGEAVVVDESGRFIIGRAAEKEPEMALDEDTGISWDDIGGLTDAKEAIREAIEYPILFADLYRGYSKQPCKGVLLYGPPGNGKTLLGRAAATALRAAHGGSAPGGFIYVKGPQVLDKFVGNTEAAVRGLFDQARKYKLESGHPAVLFIDEADALLGKREGRAFMGMEATVVPTFLAEMDGIQESGAFVMLSTNRAEMLDAAVVRDGRIDRKIEVGRPDQVSARSILHLAMRGRPIHKSETLDAVIDATVARVFDEQSVVKRIGLIEDKPLNLLVRDVISGAVLAGIANRATERAIRRDRAAGAKAPTGVTTEDMLVSVLDAAKEIQATNLRGEIMAVVGVHAQQQKNVDPREVN